MLIVNFYFLVAGDDRFVIVDIWQVIGGTTGMTTYVSGGNTMVRL